MTEQAISPFRRRMIEDMTIRKFAQRTQHDYVQRVKDFASYLHRPPDAAKPEDVRGFQLHLASSGAGVSKFNITISALRFFFNVALDRPDLSRHLSTVHEPRKVPVVLSPEEVTHFLEAAPGIKYKAAFSVAYGAGLRVCEVASLKVRDIDSKRMMLRVGLTLDGREPITHKVEQLAREPGKERGIGRAVLSSIGEHFEGEACSMAHLWVDDRQLPRRVSSGPDP
jgi:site-specific recombinase XerD